MIVANDATVKAGLSHLSFTNVYFRIQIRAFPPAFYTLIWTLFIKINLNTIFNGIYLETLTIGQAFLYNL